MGWLRPLAWFESIFTGMVLGAIRVLYPNSVLVIIVGSLWIIISILLFYLLLFKSNSNKSNKEDKHGKPKQLS